ncbi:Hydroxymethylglutaryl-CoA synthase 1 [Seiridium cupressi]
MHFQRVFGPRMNLLAAPADRRLKVLVVHKDPCNYRIDWNGEERNGAAAQLTRAEARLISADVCSLALTAVSSLLRKYNIDPKSIGRLEVGTESLIDKAKSVKSVLTSLFEPSGNTSLEGIDTIHACYGGTSALFNAVNWVQSRSWDGRDAVVVAFDIALYDQPASRPTGGAGCVAMLIGPNASLSLDPSLKGVYITNTYDFYKPDPNVEFLLVNGYKESLRDKDLEKVLIAATKARFQEQVEPCIAAPSFLISNIDISTAQGKTIGMFSYGSGAASTLFTLRVTGDLSSIVQKVDLMGRLAKRHIRTPEEYEQACALRLNAYGERSYKPVGDITSLLPGTYYLESIDEEYRRTYLVKAG